MYVYLHMQVSKYIHMCVYTQTYIYMHKYLYMYNFLYMCTVYTVYKYKYIYIYTYICMYVCIYIYLYVHVCYTIIYIYTCKYIYIYYLHICTHLSWHMPYIAHPIHQLPGLAVRFRHRWQRQDLETLGWWWPVYGQMVVDPLVFFIRKTCGKHVENPKAISQGDFRIDADAWYLAWSCAFFSAYFCPHVLWFLLRFAGESTSFPFEQVVHFWGGVL